MSSIVEMQTKLDAYKAARDMRLEEQRKVDNLKKQENEMQYDLVTFLQDNPEINGIVGTTHKAIVTHTEVPIIDDMELFQKFIVAEDAWDCAYTLRPSAPAIRDRLEDGEVPGIGWVTEHKLSVTKI